MRKKQEGDVQPGIIRERGVNISSPGWLINWGTTLGVVFCFVLVFLFSIIKYPVVINVALLTEQATMDKRRFVAVIRVDRKSSPEIKDGQTIFILSADTSRVNNPLFKTTIHSVVSLNSRPDSVWYKIEIPDMDSSRIDALSKEKYFRAEIVTKNKTLLQIISLSMKKSKSG